MRLRLPLRLSHIAGAGAGAAAAQTLVDYLSFDVVATALQLPDCTLYALYSNQNESARSLQIDRIQCRQCYSFAIEAFDVLTINQILFTITTWLALVAG